MRARTAASIIGVEIVASALLLIGFSQQIIVDSDFGLEMIAYGIATAVIGPILIVFITRRTTRK
jgi:hypothetical protein